MTAPRRSSAPPDAPAQAIPLQVGSALREGAVLGPLRIDGVLSRTGARRVYAATEVGSGASVAVKLGWPRRAANGRLETAEQVLARLRREAEVLRRIDGAGVPLLREVSEEPPYLVLERIDGADLEQTLSTRIQAFSGPEIATLCAALAGILSTVHAAGFLHGDVKPANVILREAGAPVLVDFGSARALVAQDGRDADEWSLTPGYAPPEFHFANAAVGPWSDIYSLGAVAYRLIAGRPPVSAEARLRGASMSSAGEAAGPSVSDELAALVDWALELDPAARPFSVEEWRQALSRIMADRTEDGDTVRVRRRSRPELRAVQSSGMPIAATQRRIRARVAVLGFAALAVAAATALVGRDLYRLYQNHTKQDWIVDASGQGDETTIAAALRRARDGATIHIRPGAYQENLTISRPVELVGIAQDGQQPVVAPAEGVTVTAGGTRISGLTLRCESGADRKAPPCLDVAARTTIDGVRIVTASGGVLVRDGAELRLAETSVRGGSVVATGSARLTMVGGEILEAGRSAVIGRGGAALHLSGTKISGSGEAGLLLAEGAVARMEAVTIDESGTSGVEIGSGASAVIADSMIARARQAGIYIVDGGRAEIERTQVGSSGLSGLIVAAAGEVTVEGSVFAENREHGVLLLDLTNGRIANSRMVGNGGHGIAVERGAAAELMNNVVERNREPQTLDTRRSDGGGADRRRGGAS